MVLYWMPPVYYLFVAPFKITDISMVQKHLLIYNSDKNDGLSVGGQTGSVLTGSSPTPVCGWGLDSCELRCFEARGQKESYFSRYNSELEKPLQFGWKRNTGKIRKNIFWIKIFFQKIPEKLYIRHFAIESLKKNMLSYYQKSSGQFDPC